VYSAIQSPPFPFPPLLLVFHLITIKSLLIFIFYFFSNFNRLIFYWLLIGQCNLFLFDFFSYMITNKHSDIWLVLIFVGVYLL